MNRSRARLLAVVMILAACGAAGCHNKVRMKYDARHQMIVPVLSTGDVIEWNSVDEDNIHWEFNNNPCEKGSPKGECKIAAGHSGKIFSFKCKDNSCDPEIAVDDSAGTMLTYGTRGRGQATSASGVKRIKFGCDGDELKITDASNISPGDVVDWLPVGLAKAEWSVKFQHQPQSEVCGHDDPNHEHRE